MIAATDSTPSTVIWPVAFALMIWLGLAHPGETTYQSGSLSASRGLLMPSVLQGRRPTAGRAQLPAALPSLTGSPTQPGASGQGRKPGLSSVIGALGVAVWLAT